MNGRENGQWLVGDWLIPQIRSERLLCAVLCDDDLMQWEAERHRLRAAES